MKNNNQTIKLIKNQLNISKIIASKFNNKNLFNWETSVKKSVQNLMETNKISIFRVGANPTLLFRSNTISFSFDKNNNNTTKKLILNSSPYQTEDGISKLIYYMFLSINFLTSKPTFIEYQDKIVIRISVYYFPNNKKTNINNYNDSNKRYATSNTPKDIEQTKILNKFKIQNYLIEKYLTHTNLKRKKNKKMKRLNKRFFHPLLINKKFNSMPLVKITFDNNTVNSAILNKYGPKLKDFCIILGKIFGKKVELDILNLKYAYHDSNIFAHLLGYNVDKYSFHKLISKLIPRVKIHNPSLAIVLAKEKEEKKDKLDKYTFLNQMRSYLPGYLSLTALGGLHFLMWNVNRLNMKNKSNNKIKMIDLDQFRHTSYLSELYIRNSTSLDIIRGKSAINPAMNTENMLKNLTYLVKVAIMKSKKIMSLDPSLYDVVTIEDHEEGNFFYNQGEGLFYFTINEQHKTDYEKKLAVESRKKLPFYLHPLLRFNTDIFNSLISLKNLEQNKKNIIFREIYRKISNIPRRNHVAGLNIKLGGRIMTEALRPRFSVQKKQEGSLARVKVPFVQKSRYTAKNKRGTFSFTVQIGEMFNR
jgi:hypothetical protein